MLRRSHIIKRTTVSTIAECFDNDSTFGRCHLAEVAVERDGKGIIVADNAAHVVRKISPQSHNLSILAGTGVRGHRDGAGTTVAQFNSPSGVAADENGNVIVADTDNHCIRKITSEGRVSTLAGNGTKGYQNGEGSVAQFDSPSGVAVDGDGNIIVADRCNHRICLITSQGQVSTVAGTTGVKGHRDGDEGTVSTHFDSPFGVAVDADGNVIVADQGNHCIRLITPHGQVFTLAGTGAKGYRDGEGIVAQFDSPSGVAVDGGGNVVVTDTTNLRIRLITPQGQVSTLAGTGAKGGEDGEGTVANFYSPGGVAVDGDGNVIVADNGGYRFSNPIRCVVSGVLIPRRVEFLNHGLPPLLQSSFASDLQRHLFDSGYFYDVYFVVEQERVPGHRSHLSARCAYFRSMFGAGFKEGDSAEIHIEGTTSAAFKVLLKYLYTDSMEVDDAVLFDLAKLCDQYLVERLFNHCVHQLFKGFTVQNGVMRLVQAHTASGETGRMWGKLKSATMGYVTRNFKEIQCNARATLELLDCDHPELYKQILFVKCGIVEQ